MGGRKWGVKSLDDLAKEITSGENKAKGACCSDDKRDILISHTKTPFFFFKSATTKGKIISDSHRSEDTASIKHK